MAIGELFKKETQIHSSSAVVARSGLSAPFALDNIALGDIGAVLGAKGSGAYVPVVGDEIEITGRDATGATPLALIKKSVSHADGWVLAAEGGRAAVVRSFGVRNVSIAADTDDYLVLLPPDAEQGEDSARLAAEKNPPASRRVVGRVLQGGPANSLAYMDYRGGDAPHEHAPPLSRSEVHQAAYNLASLPADANLNTLPLEAGVFRIAGTETGRPTNSSPGVLTVWTWTQADEVKAVQLYQETDGSSREWKREYSLAGQVWGQWEEIEAAAGVAVWAEDGNTDDIPAAKIPSGQELLDLLGRNPIVALAMQGATLTATSNDGTRQSFAITAGGEEDTNIYVSSGRLEVNTATGQLELTLNRMDEDGQSVANLNISTNIRQYIQELVKAGVADWAEAGNTDDIPAAKIPSGQELLQLLSHNPIVRLAMQQGNLIAQSNDGTTQTFAITSGGEEDTNIYVSSGELTVNTLTGQLQLILNRTNVDGETVANLNISTNIANYINSRVSAGVHEWARAGDTSLIPANKLPAGGRPGDSVEIQYSADNSTWVDNPPSGVKYIRFRVGSSGDWTNGVEFVGSSIQYQFSTDGTGTGAGAWADELTDAHKFIRFRTGSSGGWTIGVRFRADDSRSLPPGGGTGQLLGKRSATSFDVEWLDPVITQMIDESGATTFASAQHHHYAGNPYRYEAGQPIKWDDERQNLEGIALNAAKTRFLCPKGTYLVMASHYNRDVHQEFGLFANFGNGVHRSFGTLMGRAVTTGTAHNSNHPHSLYGIVTFTRDHSEISLVPSSDMHTAHDSINIGIVRVDGGAVSGGENAHGFMSAFSTNRMPHSTPAGTNFGFNPNSLTGDSPTFNSNHTLTLPAGKYTLFAFLPSGVSNPQNVGNDALFQWHLEREGGGFDAVGIKGTANSNLNAVVGFGYSRTASYVVESDSRITVALRCEAALELFEAEIGIVIASTGGAQGVKGDKGEGVPPGGARGEALIKESGRDYDTRWGPVSALISGGATAHATAQHHKYSPGNTYNYVAGNPITWDDENQNLEGIALNRAKTRFAVPKGTYMVVASHENRDEHQEYQLFAGESGGAHEAFGNRMGRAPADGRAGTPAVDRPTTLQGVVTFEQETGGEISLVPSRSHNGHHDSINIAIAKIDAGASVAPATGGGSGFMSAFRTYAHNGLLTSNDNIQLYAWDETEAQQASPEPDAAIVMGDMPTFGDLTNDPVARNRRFPTTFTLPPGKYTMMAFLPEGSGEVTTILARISWQKKNSENHFESVGLEGSYRTIPQGTAEDTRIPRAATYVSESDSEVTMALRIHSGIDIQTFHSDITIVILSAGGADGKDGEDGRGVPAGGKTGDFLGKADDTNFNTVWLKPPSGLPPGGAQGEVLTKHSGADGDAGWEDLRPGANSHFSTIESSNDFADNTGGGEKMRWNPGTRHGDAINLNSDRDIITLPPGTWLLLAFMPAYTLNENLYRWHAEPSGSGIGTLASSRRGHVETRLPRTAIAVLPHSDTARQVSIRSTIGHEYGNKVTAMIISKGGSRGPRGHGVPEGGTARQIIEKIDDTPNNTRWTDPPPRHTFLTFTESIGLSSSLESGYQWSFANGEVGRHVGAVMWFPCEIVGITMHALSNSVGTSQTARIGVRVDGVQAAAFTTVGGERKTIYDLPVPKRVNKGQLIQLQTLSAAWPQGNGNGAVVCLYLRELS